MSKVPIGTVVYIKKSATSIHDSDENPRVIIAHKTRRSGHVVAVLDNGRGVPFGELTDVPCSIMGCNNCKYHNHRKEAKE